MSEFGALSLVPPLLAIILAIVTRKAILALFLGVWSGGVIFTGSVGLVQTFDWIVAAIADEFHVQILMFTLFLGAGVAFLWRLGGSYAIRDWAIDRLDSQRKVGLAAWVLGIAMFFDDYANTAIVGSSIKDVSDHMRVSREKLSYIVDSTAAPVATLGISSWVAFQLSLIGDGYAEAGFEPGEHPAAFEVFIQSIPFNAYSLLAIFMVALIVISRRDFGEMLTAEHRSWQSGNVNREGARPMQDVEAELGEPNIENPMLRSFFVPIGVLLVVTLSTAVWTGYAAGAADLQGAIVDADYAAALVYGSFAMIVSAIVIGLVYGLLSIGDAVETVVDGFGLMLTAVTILVLAWSIGEVVSALETGAYVAAIADETLPPALLPAVVLLLAAFIAFSTGTSWGTMGILTPIAIPVAWSLTGDHTMVAAVVGTIFSGAIFGDHTSPISDTTVLSSTFTGADLIDHVRTQMYYAVTVAIVAIGLLIVWGTMGISMFILLPIGVVLLIGLVYGLSTVDARRKGVTPVAVAADRTDSDEDSW